MFRMTFNRFLPSALTLTIWASLFAPGSAAEPTPVRFGEGSAHAFLLVRSLKGRVVAEGDVAQTIRNGNIVSHLIFRFLDGSRDEETTIFSQKNFFRVLYDHHLQKGPFFPHPYDITIDTLKNHVTVLTPGKDGRQQTTTDDAALPPDLINGVLVPTLKNISNTANEGQFPYLAAAAKPRIVKLSITRKAIETFSVAGTPYKATHFKIVTDLGAVAAIVAPLIGKKPSDIEAWVTVGEAPTLVRLDGPLYLGGPIVSIQLATPVWPKTLPANR